MGAAASAPLLALAEWRLVDLGRACLLPESLAGFRSVLHGEGSAAANNLIIPGAPSLDEAIAGEHLERGGTVLLECGFGFAVEGLAGRADAYFPYVEYSWPVRALIREFQPVWVRAAAGYEVIGTFCGRAVALRRRVGRGTLVVLGSPIGPVLLAGDADARRWLRSLILDANEPG